MATVAKSIVRPNIGTGVGCIWGPMTSVDVDGGPLEEFNHADRSVQVDGVPSGASVTLQGSNNGTSWYTMTDPTGLPVVLTQTGLRGLTECTRFIRPLVSGGDANTSLIVTVFGRRNAA